jgi:hypothetical protein
MSVRPHFSPLNFREAATSILWLAILSGFIWLNLHMLNSSLRELSQSPAMQEMIKIEEAMKTLKCR